MASGRADVSRQLQTLFTLGTAGALTDGELLERFASRRGAVADAAFAALVERHGPLVLRVCRDILPNPADAEDAFQATFLVLVRRAGSIRNRDSVASWLHGVALRVAGCARSASFRRRHHETKAAERTTGLVEGGGDRDDLGPVLHDEVGRLPEKYRAAVVLCYWEGLTHEQAADRLQWPVGTVRSRLSWARQRLRLRLTRRGLAPAVAMAIVELSTTALAVPVALVECTVQGGLKLAAGQVPAGVVSASAGVLAEGVIRTMMVVKWKVAAAVLSTVGITTAGAGGLLLLKADEPQKTVTTKGETSKAILPDRESSIDEQIRKLMAFRNDLSAKIALREKDWLDLSEKSIVDLIAMPPTPSSENASLPRAMPSRIALDEDQQVREELFKTNMKLIETEAAYRNREDEIKARGAGVDPELLLQKRIKDALRKDPEIASLMKEIDQANRKLHALIARKQEELTLQFRSQGDGVPPLQELNEQIDALKARKSGYENLRTQLQVANQKVGSAAARMALAREDLASLREMRTSVEKWIEQLRYDAGATHSR